jgi:uncharacterized protein (DUF849 family)
MSVRFFLQAALNGDRDHPSAPRTPERIAADAIAAVAAGAQSVHTRMIPMDGRR